MKFPGNQMKIAEDHLSSIDNTGFILRRRPSKKVNSLYSLINGFQDQKKRIKDLPHPTH